MKTTYSAVARYLHWINAALLIVTWLLHEVMEDNPSLLRLHIMFGTVALVVTAIQIVWYLVDTPPAQLPDMSPWRMAVFKWNHRLILLAALLTTATGLGITLNNGLGLFPSASSLDNLREVFFNEPHELLSTLLLLLFLAHVVGVLSYQFTKGNSLGRMAPLFFAGRGDD